MRLSGFSGFVFTACALFLQSANSHAESGLDVFREKVYPVLSKRCQSCHGENQTPHHSSEDIQIAYKEAKRMMNPVPAESPLWKRSQNGHCGAMNLCGFEDPDFLASLTAWTLAEPALEKKTPVLPTKARLDGDIYKLYHEDFMLKFKMRKIAENQFVVSLFEASANSTKLIHLRNFSLIGTAPTTVLRQNLSRMEFKTNLGGALVPVSSHPGYAIIQCEQNCTRADLKLRGDLTYP